MTWLIVVLVVLAVAAAAVLVYTQVQSAALQRRFGPEYERAVAAHGARRPAEAELRDVARRRGALDVHPLAAPVRARFAERWREAQLRFVDEPAASVRLAGGLVADVLRERGYPVDDVQEGTAMVSADYPDLVADYREAREVDAAAAGAGAAGTDALREAFLRYRGLFEQLMAAPAPSPSSSPSPGDEHDAARERAGAPALDARDDTGDERPRDGAFGTVVAAARRANLGRLIPARRTNAAAEAEAGVDRVPDRTASDR